MLTAYPKIFIGNTEYAWWVSEWGSIQEICEAWTGGHKEGAQTKTPSLPPLVWGHRAQSLGTRAPFLLATLKTQQDRKNRNRILWLTQFPGRQELPRRLCTQVSALPSLFLERTHYATRRYRPENQLLPLTLVCLFGDFLKFVLLCCECIKGECSDKLWLTIRRPGFKSQLHLLQSLLSRLWLHES